MTDSLIGRKDIIQIYPFSFEEFLLSKEMIADKKDINLSYYQPYREEYITYGGYPQVVLATSINEKTQLFINLYKDYLFRDIALLLKEKEFASFSKFIELIAGKVTSQCNISSLCEEFGAKRKTIEKYLFVLENTFVIKLVSPYVGGNIKGEIKKYQKIYFHDTGVLRYIL
jgi:uncharacterized protein